MKNVLKLFGIIAFAAIIGFSMTACPTDEGNDSGGGGGVNWWTWVSTSADGNYDSKAQVAITPASKNTVCNVSVTGTANDYWYNWASQVICGYTATAGKAYKVSWKWAANDKPFTNVTIRYAQQKDFQNDEAYQLGTTNNRLTIPVSEVTVEYVFIMPDTDKCLSNFTFKVGEDIGSFKIRNFKIEAIKSSNVVGTWECELTRKQFGEMSGMSEAMLEFLKIPNKFKFREAVLAADGTYKMYEFDPKTGTIDREDPETGTYVVIGDKITTTRDDGGRIIDGTVKGNTITFSSVNEEGKTTNLTFKKK